MMKLIARWGLLAYIWNKHHSAIRIVCLCTFLLLLVVVLHSEYIAYCDVSASISCNASLSYILKWGGILTIVLVAIALLKLRFPQQTSLKVIDNPHRVIQPKSDAFDVIRNKAKLSSRGDRLIQSKPDR